VPERDIDWELYRVDLGLHLSLSGLLPWQNDNAAKVIKAAIVNSAREVK
jgi:hypothetical protein